MLSDDISEMPKNWNRRFKHNRDKIKTGDIYELAEVVRNLAIREQDKGLSTGEKQMYTRAKKILASELMYALEKTEDEAEAYLDQVLTRENLAACGRPRLEHAPRTCGLVVRRACAAAIVVAAGSGTRLGAGRPKAFVALAGRPMVAWSLDAIAAAGVPRAIVAVPPGHGAVAEEALGGAAGDFPLGLALVEGGDRALGVRAQRARRGRRRRGGRRARRRAAARPGRSCSPRRSPRWPTPTRRSPPPASPDTIKEAGADGVVVRTHDRSRLWAIQTPQAFRADVLRRALDVPDDVLAAATDDAWLVERAGGRVRVVESSAANFKVTTPHDLAVAEGLLC